MILNISKCQQLNFAKEYPAFKIQQAVMLEINRENNTLAKGCTYHSRLKGRLELTLLQRLPVDLVKKERVFLYCFLAAVSRHAAQPPVRVLRHERLQDRDGVLGQPHRIQHLVVQDRLEQVVLIVGLEGRLASHHLIHEHAQGPPVNAEAVIQLLKDLWGNIVGRAAEGRCQTALEHALLAHAEIGDLAVAFTVEQNVVQLQVTVNDAVLVQETER